MTPDRNDPRIQAGLALGYTFDQLGPPKPRRDGVIESDAAHHDYAVYMAKIATYAPGDDAVKPVIDEFNRRNGILTAASVAWDPE